MEDVRGPERQDVARAAPFAGSDLRRRANVCVVEEWLCAESSGLRHSLLRFVLVAAAV